MEALLVYLCFLAGIPLPESLCRPVAERWELCCHRDHWPPVDLQERAWRGLSMPPMSYVHYLPPLCVCHERACFNSAHGTWLEAQQGMNPDQWQGWQTWRRENMVLGTFWQAARDCQSPHYSLWTRRKDLAIAYGMVEPDDWHAGRLPPHAPWWFFKEDR